VPVVQGLRGDQDGVLAITAGNYEFQRFLHIATGSASELEYHFLLAKDLGFLPDVEYGRLEDAITEFKRMLPGLTKQIEADRLNADHRKLSAKSLGN
jgi:23S rRNA-intervening sequence protein